MADGELIIRQGYTELETEIGGKPLVFIPPIIGPGGYVDIKERIEKALLNFPTAAETVSLVYAARKDNFSNYAKEILERLNGGLLTSTVCHYFPNKGVYIQDNPRVENRKIIRNENELVLKSEEKNLGVRFVPFRFKVGEQNARDLVRNSFVIGLVGEEGAERLSEIAGDFGYPSVSSFNNVDEPLTMPSALCIEGLDCKSWFVVNGKFNYMNGSAFGIRSQKFLDYMKRLKAEKISRELKRSLDDSFKIIEEAEAILRGEKPRV